MHFRSRVKNKTMLYWRFHKSNSSKIKYFLRSYKTLSLSDYFFKVTVIFFNTSHALMSVEMGTLLLCKLLKICPDVQILIILNYPFISFFISHLNAVYSAGLSCTQSARGIEPHTHRIWSTSFCLVVT